MASFLTYAPCDLAVVFVRRDDISGAVARPGRLRERVWVVVDNVIDSKLKVVRYFAESSGAQREQQKHGVVMVMSTLSLQKSRYTAQPRGKRRPVRTT